MLSIRVYGGCTDPWALRRTPITIILKESSDEFQEDAFYLSPELEAALLKINFDSS
jgi:hypothetical protein